MQVEEEAYDSNKTLRLCIKSSSRYSHTQGIAPVSYLAKWGLAWTGWVKILTSRAVNLHRNEGALLFDMRLFMHPLCILFKYVLCLWAFVELFRSLDISCYSSLFWEQLNTRFARESHCIQQIKCKQERQFMQIWRQVFFWWWCLPYQLLH